MAVQSQPISSQKTGARPLSPHLTIYQWAVTMIVSITHRATGMALGFGSLVLAWWLFAISNGPESYNEFYEIMATPLGLLILFGFGWSLMFHLLNGIRHLAWDLGYGFEIGMARKTGLGVIVLSLLLALGAAVLLWSGNGGYLR
jgi:succinate dehydrogenase / fumarate reductase cytochrome b subunit